MHTNSTTHRSHKGKNWIFVENGQKMCDWMIALGKKSFLFSHQMMIREQKQLISRKKAKIVPPWDYFSPHDLFFMFNKSETIVLLS